MSVRWYRLDGHTAVRVGEDRMVEYFAEAERRWDGIRAGVDPWLVAHTDLGDGREVSTVFLGLDHQLFDDGPPLLFETMVFPECEVCERCSTWEQAVAQHAAVVEQVSPGSPAS